MGSCHSELRVRQARPHGENIHLHAERNRVGRSRWVTVHKSVMIGGRVRHNHKLVGVTVLDAWACAISLLSYREALYC